MAAAVLLASTIAFAPAYSFAEKQNESADPQIKTEQNIKAPINREQMRERLRKALNGLVKDGTITRDQADAVLDTMEQRWQKMMGKLEKGGPCKDGKCRPGGPKHMEKPGVLQDLVKNGTITKEQADAIRKAIRSVHEEMTKSNDKS